MPMLKWTYRTKYVYIDTQPAWHEYKVVKIGNLEWISENLCNAWPGATISSAGEYNKSNYIFYAKGSTSSITDGKGLLFSYYGSNPKSILDYVYDSSTDKKSTGWRIPTRADYVYLLGLYPNAEDLIRIEDGGTNLSGFGENLTAGDKANWGSGSSAYRSRTHQFINEMCDTSEHVYMANIKNHTIDTGDACYYRDSTPTRLVRDAT